MNADPLLLRVDGPVVDAEVADPDRCPVFRVVLHVAGGAFELEVAALPRDEVAGGIVGRDVLSHLVFMYDGPRGSFVLSSTPPT